MNNKALLHLAVFCVACLPVYAGNIVFNPGFEDSGGSLNGWTTPNSGWFVTSIPVNSGSNSVRTPCVGTNCLGPSGVGLYQDLTTNSGDTYTLTFYVDLLDGQLPNELQVYWGDTQVDDLLNQTTTTWEQVQVTGLSAATGTTRLEFFGRKDVGNLFLDDISVIDTSTPASVPEPTTAWTVGGGLLLAALRFRRSRSLA